MFSNIVKLNTAIGLSALLFQVTVLYPWHNDISKQIDNINQEPQFIKLSTNKVINAAYIKHINLAEPDKYAIHLSSNIYNPDCMIVCKKNEPEGYEAINEYIKRLP